MFLDTARLTKFDVELRLISSLITFLSRTSPKTFIKLRYYFSIYVTALYVKYMVHVMIR